MTYASSPVPNFQFQVGSLFDRWIFFSLDIRKHPQFHTSVVQHPRVVRPVAVRLLRGTVPAQQNLPSRGGCYPAVAGRNRLQQPPSRGGSCPAFSQEPPARIAGTASPPGRNRSRLLPGSGGCCRGSLRGSRAATGGSCAQPRGSWFGRKAAPAQLCLERSASADNCQFPRTY